MRVVDVPAAVAETASAALATRAERQGGGNARAVVCATALSSGHPSVGELLEVRAWHRRNPEQIRDGRCTLIAGMYGGVPARSWLEALGGVTAAAMNPVGKGAMIALPVDIDVAKSIARDDGEAPDAMHLTLFHLASDIDTLDPKLLDRYTELLAERAGQFTAPLVELTHVERFELNDDDVEPAVAVSHSPDIYAIRDDLERELYDVDLPFADDHSFRAHICIGYYPPGDGPPSGPYDEHGYALKPDALELHWGAQVHRFPFATPPAQTAAPSPDVQRQRRAARLNRLAKRVAEIDRKLALKIHGAAETTLADALRLGGVKLDQKARTKAQRAALEADQGYATPGVLAALGIGEQDLVRHRFDSLFEKLRDWFRDAERRKLEVAARELKPDPALGEREDADWNAQTLVARFEAEMNRRSELAASVLVAGLGWLAIRQLAKATARRGEVPFGLVRGSLDTARLGREPQERFDAFDDEPPRLSWADALGGDFLLDAFVERLIAEREPTVERVGTWVHGAFGEPKDPFDPHVALDGTEEIRTPFDERLAADPNDFPFVSHYWPGDHDHDTCDVEWEYAVAQAEPPGDATILRFENPADPFGIAERSLAMAGVHKTGRAAALERVLARGRPALTAAGDWDEEAHNRDDAGRFGQGSGDGPAIRAGDARVGQSIIDRVREQGGLTVRPLTGAEPTEGYVVAQPGHSSILPADDFYDREKGIAAIDRYLEENADHFDEQGWLGLWHDTDHDEVVLDLVDNPTTLTREDAMKLGAERDQQSIWDVVNQTEIDTGGTGGRPEGQTATAGEAAEARRGDDEGRTASVRDARVGSDGRATSALRRVLARGQRLLGRTAAFSDDQERDDQGRWTSTGAGRSEQYVHYTTDATKLSEGLHEGDGVLGRGVYVTREGIAGEGWPMLIGGEDRGGTGPLKPVDMQVKADVKVKELDGDDVYKMRDAERAEWGLVRRGDDRIYVEDPDKLRAKAQGEGFGAVTLGRGSNVEQTLVFDPDDVRVAGARASFDPGQARDADGKFSSGGADVGAHVDKLREHARSIEPEATRAMRDAATNAGGTLLGFDFRFKGAGSLERKLNDKVAEGLTPKQAAESISDSLRYTVGVPAEQYAQGWDQTKGALEEQGWQLEAARNYWERGDAYSGLNTIWREPGGTRVEVQLHTPESHAVKEELHKPYEEARDSSTSQERRAELERQMAARWEDVTVPPGALDIGTLHRATS